MYDAQHENFVIVESVKQQMFRKPCYVYPPHTLQRRGSKGAWGTGSWTADCQGNSQPNCFFPATRY
jgi:hypothetical protein